MAEAKGLVRAPAVKWLGSPSDVVTYLARTGLDELLAMGMAAFWRFDEPLSDTFQLDIDSTCRLRALADRLVDIDGADRALIEPKRAMKSEAIARGASPTDLLHVRSVLAQVGWLETSLAAGAVQIICEVEKWLQAPDANAAEASIHPRLTAFDAWEAGLLATWETPSEIICVARTV